MNRNFQRNDFQLLLLFSAHKNAEEGTDHEKSTASPLTLEFEAANAIENHVRNSKNAVE